MDFKGIRWVGNVYQKFEAMCLEVEEIILQDTAKYVENQVQTVGNSVKKFCSDVVQDLLPDESAVGSGKPLPVSMLHEYAPVCSFKKKRVSVSGKNGNLKKEQEGTEGKKDGCAMNLRGLDADAYDICTSPRQGSYGGPYRRTRVGRKQIFKKEELFQVTRPFIQKDSSSNLSVVHSTRVKDDAGTVKSSDSIPGGVGSLVSKEECQKDNRTESKHGITVVNSVRSRDSEIRTENEQGLPVRSQNIEIGIINEPGLMTVSSVRSQDSEIRTEKEQSLAVFHSVRNQDSEIQPSVATSIAAGFDDYVKETSSSSVSDQMLEILQQFNGRSVEESCILVDRDEFHCVYPEKKENDKHKPYKNFRDAISSRMKQNREKEYKRLARQWYAEDVENGIECGDNSKQIEENQSSEESEWELL